MPPRSQKRRWWLRALVVILVALGVGLWVAYSFVTDGKNLEAVLAKIAKRYLPEASLGIDRVLVRPFVGQVELRHVLINQRIDQHSLTTIQIPFIQIHADTSDALHGNIAARRIVLTQPKLRLKRRENGAWNIQGLLANPWPGPLSPEWPTIEVRQGLVELQDGNDPATIFHDVNFTLEPNQGDWLKFEGDAQGDVFQRITFSGYVHGTSGEVRLAQADVRGLVLDDHLRERLPVAWSNPLEPLGRLSGRFDVLCTDLAFNPRQPDQPQFALNITLRDGNWQCPKFPFPLSAITAQASYQSGILHISHAEGHFGNTILRVLQGSSLDIANPETGPLQLKLQALELELDQRIAERVTPELLTVWNTLLPPGRSSLGRVRLDILATRNKPDDQVELELDFQCLDVAVQPAEFPYLIEHLRGAVHWRSKQITFDLATIVGGQVLTGKGSIDDPLHSPTLSLQLDADGIPIDDALLDALPPEASAVVRDFQPAGAIAGRATVAFNAATDSEPRVTADLRLDGVREMRWSALPYPIRKLSGRLLIEPNRWTFQKLKGENGLAHVDASGVVDQPKPGVFAVDIELHARNLKFDRELKNALPKAWQSSWDVLNPVGSSNVDARVVVRPDQPDQYHFRVTPDDNDETRLHLKLTPAPNTPGAPSGGPISLPPFEHVRGAFDFDNGVVRMSDVSFHFREAPVRFARGEVILNEDTGQFDLKVSKAAFNKLRLDAPLRKIMPQTMAAFAEYLDDGKGFTAHAAALGIAWSGQPADPAVCTWENATVDFLDNSIKAAVPLEHLHGRITQISGRSDGRSVLAKGNIDLDNLVIQNQQLTNVSTPVEIASGWARLPKINATLLGGNLTGGLAMSFESTPSFQAGLKLQNASLQELARTIPGRQDFTGQLSAWVALEGRGADIRTMQGKGGLQVTEADLGKLPMFVRLINPLNLPRDKRAFDRADVSFTLNEGLFNLNPIKFTGNTISLQGAGAIDPALQLEARLTPLYGRDERLHIPFFSDAAREASSQILAVTAQGPVTSPQFKAEFMPTAQRMVQGFGKLLERDDNSPPRPIPTPRSPTTPKPTRPR